MRRLSWFTLGLAAGAGSTAWMAVQLRRMREQLTPAAVGRAAALTVADALDLLSRTVRPRPR